MEQLPSLDDLRTAIDAIDAKIIALLQERMEQVKQVGAIKAAAQQQKSFIRSGREATMLKKRIEALSNSYPPLAIASLWRTIISASLNAEHVMPIGVYAENKETSRYWLTREYFGAFTPIGLYKTSEQVINAVATGKISVGVLPVPDERERWWKSLVVSAAAPKIFAILPVIEEAHIIPLVAIANVEPEETGDDMTFLVIKTHGILTPHTINNVCKAQGIKVLRLHPADHGIYLLEVEGFVQQSDKRIAAIEEALASHKVQLVVIGSYAMSIKQK